MNPDVLDLSVGSGLDAARGVLTALAIVAPFWTALIWWLA